VVWECEVADQDKLAAIVKWIRAGSVRSGD
jgi:hypothetical protein